MQIHELMKSIMTDHKQKIVLTQWAIISSISSLLYSEYIRRMKNKVHPIRATMVPKIHTIHEILNPEGPFVQDLSENLINGMRDHKLFKTYANAPELILFKDDNIEILKTIFDLYMVPNIINNIPNTIQHKFGLDDPNNQHFIQDRTIDLFERKGIEENGMKYIIDQAVLQLLLLLPTMKKDVVVPENNKNILLAEDEIFTIGHINAICEIHFNKDIIGNGPYISPDNIKTTAVEGYSGSIIDLLSFTTSTTFSECDNSTVACLKNDKYVEYSLSTNTFNQVRITTLQGIETKEE